MRFAGGSFREPLAANYGCQSDLFYPSSGSRLDRKRLSALLQFRALTGPNGRFSRRCLRLTTASLIPRRLRASPESRPESMHDCFGPYGFRNFHRGKHQFWCSCWLRLQRGFSPPSSVRFRGISGAYSRTRGKNYNTTYSNLSNTQNENFRHSVSSVVTG